MARGKQKVKIVYRKPKKKAQANQSGMFNLKGILRLAVPVAYGFFRDKVSDTIARSQIGQKLPVTQFTDEGTMLGAGWLLGKFVKNPTVRRVVSHGKTIELARIGETISDMQQMKKSGGIEQTNAMLW